MSEEEIGRKVGRAFQMIVLQKHRYPGVKGWELRRALGRDYMKYVEILSAEVSKLGLAIRNVTEEDDAQESEDKFDSARFFVVLRDQLPESQTGTLGMRIDDMAILAASVAYMIPRQGKVNRKHLEEMLREKFPRWKVQLNIDRFVRKGYLMEKDEVLSIGWRTKAEIDEKTLLNLVLSGDENPSQ